MNALPPLGIPPRMDSSHVLQQLEALKEQLLTQNPDLRIGSMHEISAGLKDTEASTSNQEQKPVGAVGPDKKIAMITISEDKLQLLVQQYVETQLRQREEKYDADNFRFRSSEISSGHDFAETSMSVESTETVRADRKEGEDPDRTKVRVSLHTVNVRSHRERSMFDPELAMSPSPGFRPTSFRAPSMKHDKSVSGSVSSKPSQVHPDDLTELDPNNMEKSEREVENSPEQDMDEDCIWVNTAQNAYGAFIHVALQSGLKSAMWKCGFLVAVSALIQSIFAAELIENHLPSFELERSNICQIPVKLQFAATLIFLTLMFNNISGMTMAARFLIPLFIEGTLTAFARISITSTHHKLGDGDYVGEIDQIVSDSEEARGLHVSMFKRIIILICAVLTEVCTWYGILMAGVLFIFTSPTVDLVIRSTVAVMFVLNVDEIVFESVRVTQLPLSELKSCCSAARKRSKKMSRKPSKFPSHHLRIHSHPQILHPLPLPTSPCSSLA
eukprot:768042-Hanusia_phi.AAC.1